MFFKKLVTSDIIIMTWDQGSRVSSVLVSWPGHLVSPTLACDYHDIIVMTCDQGPGVSSVLTPCKNKIQEWENQFHEKLKFSMIERGRF